MVTKKSALVWLDSALLVCLVIVIYGRLTGYGFQTHWDDNGYILNNPAVCGFTWEHVKSAFNVQVGKTNVGQYNPLSMLSFILDFTIWDLNPAGFHLSNIIIHALNGLLVYRLLSRFYNERLVSLTGAVIFLIHPVQVETVAWISERKGLLSLFFLLISWEWYIRSHETEQGRSRLWYALSLTAFVLSLMAKTAGVIMPLVLLVYDWCFSQGEKRVSLLKLMPFFIFSAVFTALEIFSGAGSIIGYHGDSPLATFFTMLTVFCQYLRLLVWPSGLNVEHLPPVYRSIDVAVFGAAVLLAGIGYATIRLYRIDKRSGFWMIFFWICLLPVSQIVPTILMMYEHYLYMPIIAVSALVGSGTLYLRNRFGPRCAAILYFILVVWFVALSVTSYNRISVWKNSLTLFADATSKSPNGARIWEAYGEALNYFGYKKEARNALLKSYALNPESTDLLWALGEVTTEMGDLDKGLEYLNKLFAKNPNYARGWATLGNNYKHRGNYGKAREMYNKALAIQPDAIQVVMMLGKLAIVENRLDEARGYFIRVDADPRGWNKGENAYLLACVESLAGNTDAALSWLDKALQLGYGDYYVLNTNKNLSGIWDSPRFNYMMLQYFPEFEKER